jgi:hypothetical protein
MTEFDEIGRDALSELKLLPNDPPFYLNNAEAIPSLGRLADLPKWTVHAQLIRVNCRKGQIHSLQPNKI